MLWGLLLTAGIIFASIAKISTCIQGLENDVFLEDSKTLDAVIRNIEIIGEAAKLLSEKARACHLIFLVKLCYYSSMNNSILNNARVNNEKSI